MSSRNRTRSRLHRSIAAAASVPAAISLLYPATIGTAMSDSASVRMKIERPGYASSFVPFTDPEFEQIKAMADEAASEATSIEMAGEKARKTFMIEFGYSDDDMRKCEELGKPASREIGQVARDWGVDPSLAQAISYQESNIEHFGSDGKPKTSKKGAKGLFQMLNGFDDVWEILNQSKEVRYAEFIRDNSELIEKYRGMFPQEKSMAWDLVQHSESHNIASGVIFAKFLIQKSGGKEHEALRSYVAGETGKSQFPQESSRYASRVLGHRGFFSDRCTRMDEDLETYRTRAFERHRGNFVVSMLRNRGYHIKNGM